MYKICICYSALKGNEKGNNEILQHVWNMNETCGY